MLFKSKVDVTNEACTEIKLESPDGTKITIKVG